MTKHSNLGPSSAERWWNCPGSVAAIAALPTREKSSIYAAEGTVAHALCEEFASGRLSLKALSARVGEIVVQDGFEITISDEMVEAAIEYQDLINAGVAELSATKGPQPVISKFELRVYAKSIDPLLFGTTDHLLYKKGKKLVVTDFKFGQGVAVDPEENKQAVIYAIGAMDTEAGDVFDEIEVVIHQPRAGGEPVRRWTIPKAWLAQFRIDLKAAVERTKDPKAPRVASPKACQWCPVKPVCPEAFALTQQQAMVDFAEPAAPALMPAISSLPLDKLLKALEHEDYVTSWFESARAHIKGMLDVGMTVPGYKLVEGKSNRKFIDEKQVVAEYGPLLGEEVLYERSLISPAALEKIVGKKKIDHLTFKPEGRKTIARDSDPRPAAKNSAELDFTVIAPETPKKKEPLWPL